MRSYHILGFGSIGKLIYSQLVNKGLNGIAIQHKQGIIRPFELVDQDHNTQTLSVQYSPLADTAPIERLLVCCKSYQALAALDSIHSRITPNTSIILLFNGMGAQSLIANQFPNNRIYAGSVTHGALWNNERQKLIHTGVGNIVYGRLLEKKSGLKVNSLKEDRELSADLGAQFSFDVETVLWKKLIINDIVNPLTVKHHCKNGGLLQENIWLEVVNLTNELKQLYSLGICPVEIDLTQIKTVCKSTASNYSSMYCDYYLQNTNEQPLTEIDYITGYILSQAKDNGINLPLHQSLFNAIQSRTFSP